MADKFGELCMLSSSVVIKLHPRGAPLWPSSKPSVMMVTERTSTDKYVTLHVEQHNIHADLTEYGVTPLDESFKILWFQNGIKCSALDAVKASINANKALFT